MGDHRAITTPASERGIDLTLLWAKLPKKRDESGYHPLPCHLLDVAAVALVLWEGEAIAPAARQEVAARLGIDERAAGRWIAFFAGLHDIGKAAPVFQGQDAATVARLGRLGLRFPVQPTKVPHGTISAAVLAGLLSTVRALPAELASQIAMVVGGHHGVFPRSGEVNALTDEGNSAVGGGEWRAVRQALAERLADLLTVPPDPPGRLFDNATAMWLAGLISVVDWIGSNDEYFPYAVADGAAIPNPDLLSYRDHAIARAHEALDRLGWTAWPAASGTRTFGELFPGIERPHPVQEAVADLAATLDGPGLVVIEAPMGEGKTEAALYLADYWDAATGGRGVYVALPTMATSDQMFGRVHRFLAERYPTERVNLQLLHGHAALSAEFQELRRHGDRLFTPAGIAEDEDGAMRTVAAAEWFTHRKRGLLAPVGVGTVDQALLAGLQTRHVFVRLFGLAHKPVIIDEVHAYDTYMSTLLGRVLEWLGALRTPVVLLSATLPAQRHQSLVAAYARGLGASPPAVGEASYPRVSWVTPATAGATSVATSPRATKRLNLRWIAGNLPQRAGDPFPLGERLAAALANGGCAAVICNTVNRAQQVYRALKPSFEGEANDGLPVLDLLHARFLFEEREARQQRALIRFGKEGGSVEVGDGKAIDVRRPDRAVLVATQVIEQSLDLDFDLMVTDPAPADLLLQRAGRLHRHERARPAGLGDPCLWIAQPEVTPGGAPRFDPGTSAVYDGHILLRSWLALRERDAVRIPADVEELIEAVYDDRRTCPDGLSEEVRERWEETRARHDADVASDEREAHDRWLKPPDYDGAFWRMTGDWREEDAPDFHQAHQALTRLTDKGVDVVLVWGTAEQPSLDPGGLERIDPKRMPDMPLTRRLLRRSVRLSDRRIVGELLEQSPPPGWARSPLLRHHRLIALDAMGGCSVGKHRLCLEEDIGVVVVSRDEEVC